MRDQIKKTIAAVLASAIIFSVAGCHKAPGKYKIEDISLTDSRSWVNKDAYYEDLMKTLGLDNVITPTCDGCMIIATDDDILYLYCEDSFEVDGVTPVNQYTTYDIASISKTFTAVAVLQLIEDGKISLDDTIDKYFPQYTKGADITIYNLLHMQSGIPDYFTQPAAFWGDEYGVSVFEADVYGDRISDEEFIEYMCEAELQFEPGQKQDYSNTNYHLLAMIVEIVSGEVFCDYLQKNIFDPCEMEHTSSMAVGDETSLPINIANKAAHGITDEWGHSMYPNQERGDGGIHSCAADLLAFDRALFGGKLLSEESMDELLNFDMDYGCGMMPYSATAYYHGGLVPAYHSMNIIDNNDEFGHVYTITLEHY